MIHEIAMSDDMTPTVGSDPACNAFHCRDLRECEESCEQEPQFACTTLSFSSGQSSTNCHLADTPPTALTLGRDLVRVHMMDDILVIRAKHTALSQVRDYGSDVYEKRSTAACRSGGGGDGGYTPGFNGHDYTSEGRCM